MSQLALPLENEVTAESPRFLSEDLLTYIGNKRALLPFIGEGLSRARSRLGKSRLACLDLFAGSGAVSRYMKAFASSLVSNDFEAYAQIINRCYLTNRGDFDYLAYMEARSFLLDRLAHDWRRGIIAENYAPLDDDNIQPGERVFFTRRNAEFIDTARQHIDALPADLRRFFLAPLLVRASVHSNTGGVFKGFYKNRQGVGAFGGHAGHALRRIKGHIDVPEPILSAFDRDVRVTRTDATRFASEIGGRYDLVYLDPPYNQHPFGSNYFMLNLILQYEMPQRVSKVSGIPMDWQRSPFNKPGECGPALFKIIDEIDARFFLISYSSEGFLEKRQFLAQLRQMGTLTFYETVYNTYRASRNLASRSPFVKEYLFLLEKH